MGFWDAALNVAGSLGGAIIGTVGNNMAAGRFADASGQAMAVSEAAKGRGINAIQAGTQRYAETVAPLINERPILRPFNGLTPAQTIAREDMLRGGRATLASSNLRGAGRAGVGAIMDADRRFMAGAAQQNDDFNFGQRVSERNRSGAARQGLAQVYAQEGGAIASTEVGAGNQMANNLINQGAVAANSTTANANLIGNAFGGLSAIVANEVKERNQPRYSGTRSPV
jgi:hypothetical protein